LEFRADEVAGCKEIKLSDIGIRIIFMKTIKILAEVIWLISILPWTGT